MRVGGRQSAGGSFHDSFAQEISHGLRVQPSGMVSHTEMKRYVNEIPASAMSISKGRTRWSLEKRILSMRGVPSLSKKAWDTRQRKLGIPLACDVLEMHEIVFLERFKALGNHYQWIPRDVKNKLPTNDFVWEEYGIEVELKSPTKAKYGTIAKRISESAANAAKKDVIKDSFIIDLGHVRTSDKLARQLEQYNMRSETKISNLWIIDPEGVKRINLRKK